MNPRRWPVTALLLLAAAVFLSVTTELLPTGLLPGMSRDLRVTAARLGLLVTGYAVMVALFAAPLGTATVRLRRRPLLAGTLASYTLSNTILVFAPGYPIALVARLIGGLTHGMFWAILAGYAARLVAPDRVGRAVAIVSAGGTGAVLVGVPAGTALGVAAGWRAAFAVLAGIAALLAVLTLRLLPDVPGSGAAVRTPLRDVLRLPGFPRVVATTAMTMLGAYTFITYLAPYLQNAGLTEQQISPVLLASGIVGLIALIVSGFVVDRWLHQGMIAGATVLVANLAFLAVAAGSPLPASAFTALVGLAMGTLPVFFQAMTLRVAPDHPDLASGVTAGAFNIGIAGGAVIGGVVIDTAGVALVPVVGLALATIGLAVLVAPARRRSAAPGAILRRHPPDDLVEKVGQHPGGARPG
jgi:predicted MFS family arabinose efflux permease